MTERADSAALYERGLFLIAAGRPAEARAALERAVEREPQQPAYHGALGQALHAAGRPADAADAYRRALALAPDHAPGHFNLGAALDDAGRLDEAIAAYRRAIALDPTFARACGNLGVALQRAGDADAAEAAYRRALALAPGEPWTGCNLGALLHARGRLDEAEAAYRQVTAACPDLGHGHSGLGATLLARGDGDGAARAFARARDLAPDSARAHIALGSALVAADRFADAEVAYRRAVALAATPTQRAPGADADAADMIEAAADARGGLGAALLGLDRAADAIEPLQAAIALRPTDALAHHNLGVAFARLERFADAVAAYRQAARLTPDDARIHAGLGEALRRLDRLDEARAAYRRAHELDPDDAVTAHMAAALAGEATDAAPPDYVRCTFDDYAARYDEHMIAGLDYRVPALLADALDRVAPGRRFAAALDLGCGTGLTGVALRPRLDALDGVDLSPAMLAEAERRGVYDALHEAEIGAALRAPSLLRARYELVFAADVLVYVGDLAPIFLGVKDRLAPDGVFACSVEALVDGRYALGASGRYAHSRAYASEVADSVGLALVEATQAILRREVADPVTGLILVLRRPA